MRRENEKRVEEKAEMVKAWIKGERNLEDRLVNKAVLAREDYDGGMKQLKSVTIQDDMGRMYQVVADVRIPIPRGKPAVYIRSRSRISTLADWVEEGGRSYSISPESLDYEQGEEVEMEAV